MGVVHEAHDGRLDRRVALKLIAPALAGDPLFRARFVTEARAQASLDSPHVVHVYGHGEDDGRLWIATQLLPDGDLAAMLRTHGAPPVRTALDLVAQVADGLADAHAAGLVHGDIKPSNVLLRHRSAGTTALLGDFGVARRADGPPSRSAAPVGTPAFMAPELLAGEPATRASDLYAVGCLLRALVPEVPAPGPLATAVDRVLRRATSARPQDRHLSAAALRDELRAAAARPDRSRGRAAAAAALVLLAALGCAWTTGLGRDPAPPAGDGPAAPHSLGGDGAGREQALASLAAALEAQGLVRGARAECAARRWIAAVGLTRMVAAGFFDEEMTYVDQPRRALSPRMRSAALAAVRTCRSGPQRASAARSRGGPTSTDSTTTLAW
jgi:serine/threonine-protein kinase